MKLWVLRRYDTRVIYDANTGFVIRAVTEEAARRLADNESGNEGMIWSDPQKTSCTEMFPEGQERVILRSFRHG